ncbi:MAG: thioredoxin domain-containing protein [Bryobacteraceae bacterium]|nr:thioredoxin domain-containing protein [Bryobacteraceae bacterium]
MKFAVLLCLTLALPAQQAWRVANDLPGVDFTGLTAAQKKQVLAALRDGNCTCGCQMKLAQCRVEDPACSQSTILAKLAVAAAKKGEDVVAALAKSPLAVAAANRNRILLDPVAISVEGSPVKGPENARITLVEFSDFQCPYCIRAVAQLEAVMKAYPRDVKLIYKQFPLDNHSQARLAAQASLAAHAQGKFWPLHDRMYSRSREINRANILLWANEFGLDMPKFTAMMDAPATKQAVDRDIEEGSRVGVEGTPTLFINGKKYQGALEPSVLIGLLAKE